MPNENHDITLEEQVKAWKIFEEWLHNKFSQENVDKVQDELSTVGSEKKREDVIQNKTLSP